MLSFSEAVNCIISALRDFGRSDALIRWYQAFFTTFFDFVTNYRPEVNYFMAYSLWKEQMFPVISEHRRKIASSASTALFYVIENGHIPYDFFSTLPLKARLLSAHYEILCDFVTSAESDFSQHHLKTVGSRIGTFLFRAQIQGIQDMTGLNYDFLQSFYEEHNYSVSPSKGMVLASVEVFLLYLAKRSLIPHAYAFYMNSNRHAYLLTVASMNSIDQERINDLRIQSVMDFPADEFYKSSLDFLDVLRTHNYEDTVRGIWRITSEALYLFLHWNGLGYQQEIADIWFSYYKQKLTPSNLAMSRRLMKLYEQFMESGDINPLVVFTYTATSLDLLASWCKPTVEAFLARKKKEQMAPSTVAMYTSSICRFCNWLDKKGMSSFGEINFNHIKQFDIEDPHSTIEGKAAYNSRIRGFLMYLEETGLVSGHLFKSIPTAYSKKERLVRILTLEQIESIDEYIASATTEMELRDAAMIQLGLRMGLRSIDISKLKLEEINWKTKSIRFIQQKTRVEANLPMPISVGNAIYKYIHGRSKKIQSSYVFVPVAGRGVSLSRHG